MYFKIPPEKEADVLDVYYIIGAEFIVGTIHHLVNDGSS